MFYSFLVMKSVIKLNLFFCFYILLTCSSCYGNLNEIFERVKTHASSETQQQAINDLVERILKTDAARVQVKIDAHLYPFTLVQTVNGKLQVFSKNAVDAAYGINYYLKYFCKKHISWAGDNMGKLPEPLPPIKTKLKLKPAVKLRYYQNVCTYSYSYVWWNWKRWEREIDWMVLNGINTALAFTGQEQIWDRIYKSFGCTDQDMNNHFTGPAYLAWGRMGNVKGLGGPLSNSWKANQLSLQHKILKRMRSLGMIDVLPAFAGHIPECVTKKFPKAKYSVLSPWSKFNCTHSCTYLLDPNDPLFRQIGAEFIREQVKEYNGTSHLYSCDVFNEMTPNSSDVNYLASTSFAVYDAMVSADKDASWLMQGWLFYHASWFWKQPQIKALLTAVPKGRMVILDLFAESYPIYKITESFYGQPFIWCMLHNFGGNMGFYGKVDHINNDPIEAFNSKDSSMIGIGITPEGINQNYLVYELMLEVGYHLRGVDVDTWVKHYVERRYGVQNTKAFFLVQKAVTILARTILNDPEAGKPPSKVLIRGPICKRPSLSIVGLPEWYDLASVLEAAKLYRDAIVFGNLPKTETSLYDFVDIVRQVLVEQHRLLYYNIIEAYDHDKPYSVDRLRYFGDQMMSLFDDLDQVLSYVKSFTLANWIEQARLNAVSTQEADLYETNARMQITLWGENGEILDYADKHWSTLMSTYYKPRWKLFIDYLVDAMLNNNKFDHKKYQREVFENVERPFVTNRDVIPTTPMTSIKDNLNNTLKIFDKWIPLVEEMVLTRKAKNSLKFTKEFYTSNLNSRLSLKNIL